MRRSSVRFLALKKVRLVVLGACCCILSACVLRPEWQHLAIEGKLESAWIDTGRFRHLWLWNEMQGSHLRIYVEGDGTPWIHEDRVSVDPTPPNPVLLRLMHNARHPAVYLGRPCYFGTATDSGCNERWWTFERYSKTVVYSMCQAANDISRHVGADSVQLVGYSGGGAIVIGMKECTDRLVSLSTIAGNLDPFAWTEYHGYTPLRDKSVIDVVQSTPPTKVVETHWQCGADQNVPPAITDNYFASRPGAKRHVVDSCTHATGWRQLFPRIIDVSRTN